MKKKIAACGLLVTAAVIGVIYLNLNYIRLNGKYYKKDTEALYHVDIRDKRFKASALNKFTKLKTLSTDNMNDEVWEELDSFDEVKYLYFYDAEINENTSKLNSFEKIVELHIIGSDIDLKGFENKAVESISISGGNIKNISELKNCPSLNEMFLSRMTADDFIIVEKDGDVTTKVCGLKDSSFLAELDNVKKMTIKCTRIEDISGILEMDSLEEFNVSEDMISDEFVDELEKRASRSNCRRIKFY